LPHFLCSSPAPARSLSPRREFPTPFPTAFGAAEHSPSLHLVLCISGDLRRFLLFFLLIVLSLVFTSVGACSGGCLILLSGPPPALRTLIFFLSLPFLRLLFHTLPGVLLAFARYFRFPFCFLFSLLISFFFPLTLPPAVLHLDSLGVLPSSPMSISVPVFAASPTL